MAKFTIDKIWDGKEHPRKTVIHDGIEYGPGDTFSAPESLGKGRPWLIPEAPAKKVTAKANDNEK